MEVRFSNRSIASEHEWRPTGSRHHLHCGCGNGLKCQRICTGPTIQEVNAVYVLTLTSAGGVGSIAYGVGTAMDATTFE